MALRLVHTTVGTFVEGRAPPMVTDRLLQIPVVDSERHRVEFTSLYRDTADVFCSLNSIPGARRIHLGTSGISIAGTYTSG